MRNRMPFNRKDRCVRIRFQERLFSIVGVSSNPAIVDAMLLLLVVVDVHNGVRRQTSILMNLRHFLLLQEMICVVLLFGTAYALLWRFNPRNAIANCSPVIPRNAIPCSNFVFRFRRRPFPTILGCPFPLFFPIVGMVVSRCFSIFTSINDPFVLGTNQSNYSNLEYRLPGVNSFRKLFCRLFRR